MFEALFILTTIDTGTRVSRFLVQEFGGRVWKPFEKADWLPGSLFSTALVVFAWSYFIWNGSISTIWPMFGTANQLLAGVALAVATSAIINAGKVRYVWVTLVPMLFVSSTTLVACWENVFDNFLPMTRDPATATQGIVDIIMTVIIMMCAVVLLGEAFRRWFKVLVKKEYSIGGQKFSAGDKNFSPPEYGCC
jgi:carbon starvation protein